MKSITLTLILFLYQHGYSQLTAFEVLQGSAAAMQSLKSIQYTFYAEQGNEKINGEVNINRVRPFPVFEISQVKLIAFAVSGEGSSQISFASDGSAFEYTDPGTNKLVRVEDPSITAIMQSGMMSYAMLPLPCYLQAEPFKNMIKNLEAAAMEADTLINNIACFKLKVVTKGTGPSATHEVYWFIGKEDLLVRGMHSKYLKQFIKIIASDRPFATGDFRLSSNDMSLKRTDGNEPLTGGLLAIGTPAPAWKLSTGKLKEISSETLKGKVVLLDFWGTWCMPCIKAMPDIQAIHEHFKGQAVEVIGISVELKNSTADPAAFAKTKGYTYSIALRGGEVAEKYKVLTYPSVYIIDKNGKIFHAEHSGGRENFKIDIIKRIEEALKK